MLGSCMHFYPPAKWKLKPSVAKAPYSLNQSGSSISVPRAVRETKRWRSGQADAGRSPVRSYCTTMQIQSDHKALIFLGAVAVLGAGVRVVRAASADRPSAQPALERQMSAADSSARAQATHQSSVSQRAGRSGGRSGGGGRGSNDTSRKIAQDTTRRRANKAGGLLDRPGYIGGKLDLDVATAAQIDSLPGVTPTMAKRIAADRMRRGPFLNANGLRRVSGVGDHFLHDVDTVVTFSGTLRPSVDSDTLIEKPTKTRAPRKATRPAALQREGRQRAQWRLAAADSYWPARARSALPPPAT
jgi:hypothetical protein